MALLDLINSIESSRDQNNHSIAIFLDLKKAFDVVNHKILLYKLECYGIRGPVHKLLTSYLHNRSQFKSVKGHTSSYQSVICGVPQGSVLGPLLFLLYINDFNLCCKSDFKLFADDTVIIISHHNMQHLSQLTNQVLATVHQWLLSNKLTLNLQKTTCMFFHKNKKHFDGETYPIVKLNDYQLTFTKSTKYLGFIIDYKLSFKLHI